MSCNSTSSKRKVVVEGLLKPSSMEFLYHMTDRPHVEVSINLACSTCN